MKTIIVNLFLAVLLCACLVSGCAKPDQPVSGSKEESFAGSASSENPEAVSGPGLESLDDTDPSAADPVKPDVMNILDSYLTAYGTDRYWKDQLVDYSYFLLNDRELVSLFAVPGLEQCTVVPLDSISSCTSVKNVLFTTVTVEDRAGKSVSINLGHEQAAELMNAIKPQ